MSHQLKHSLATIAHQLVLTSGYGEFTLCQLARDINPKTPPCRQWISNVRAGTEHFTGFGPTPHTAVILALCYEKTFRQGWG